MKLAEPPTEVVGVTFNCPTGMDKFEFMRAIMDYQGFKGPDCNLRIIMPCCNKVYFYRLLTDVPLEDTPCTCGKPNMWVLKWQEYKQVVNLSEDQFQAAIDAANAGDIK
jgi:hypothetical protein